jgi:hypothetical protein
MQENNSDSKQFAGSMLSKGKRLLRCLDKFQKALIAADEAYQKKEIIGREVFLTKREEESGKR